MTYAENLRLAFWRQFKRYSQARKTQLRLRKPHVHSGYLVGVGRTGFQISLGVLIRRRPVQCELYITHAEAKKNFRALREHESFIDRRLGPAKVVWLLLRTKKACRIVQYHRANFEDKRTWPELCMWLLERAERFDNVFRPLIKNERV